MVYLRSISVRAEQGAYPLNRKAICGLEDMALSASVTLLVGDNGSGKSTLMEAIARKMRLPAIGAADAAQDPTLARLDPLVRSMRLSFSKRPMNGFFLRAEDFFGFTRRVEGMQRELRTDLERIDEENEGRSAFAKGQARAAAAGSLDALISRYGLDPDARSHGESFLHLFQARMNASGMYLLDEPETPLSPIRQLTLISMIMDMEEDSQFLIATHSPLLMAYPGADIWLLGEESIDHADYAELEHVTLTRDFLQDPARYLRHLRRPT